MATTLYASLFPTSGPPPYAELYGPNYGAGTYYLVSEAEDQPFPIDFDMLWAETATELQVVFDTTSGAGGTPARFISGRVPAGGFTLSGTVTFGLRARESAMTADIRVGCILYRRLADGSLQTIFQDLGGFFDHWFDGTELSTSNTNMTWGGTPEATVFNEDDRIVVDFFIANVGIGVMTPGFQGTVVGVDVTGIPQNFQRLNRPENFVQISETVSFKPELVVPPGMLLGIGP